MNKVLDKQRKRAHRKTHIRKRISGTATTPRVSVYRSNKHMYIQAIDDTCGCTIMSASTVEKEFSSLKNNVENAKKLGMEFGKRLLEKKIETVVFDRNGFKYHGIVKNLADGARESGLKF